MKKKIAAIVLSFLVLLPTTAAYAEEPTAAAEPGAGIIAAAAADDIVITQPLTVEDGEVEIVLANLTANAMISFQAFYTAPATAEAPNPTKELDYINQYTLDGSGKLTITYPPRSDFAPGGMLTVVIGEAGLTTEQERTRTYTFSAYEIKSIQIRTLDE